MSNSNSAFRENNNPVRVVLPDRIVITQLESLVGQAATIIAETEHRDRDEFLNRVTYYLAGSPSPHNPPPPHPCDEWREEWEWDHG